MALHILMMISTFCVSLHAQTIHVFGDSHALHCFTNEKRSEFYLYTDIPSLSIPIEIHWQSRTMHVTGKNGLAVLNIKVNNVQERDIAVFVFGEIDVRCHIGKQRDLYKRNLDEIIETLAVNYIETIKKNKYLYENITCVVTSILPPTNQGNNPNLPTYGSLHDRINIARKLNKKLKKLCSLNLLEFLDIYNLYATPKGSLKSKLSDGQVHVHPEKNKPIKIKLINFLLAKGILTL